MELSELHDILLCHIRNTNEQNCEAITREANQLLQQNPELATHTETRYNALHAASYHWKVNILKKLLELGADVNVTDHRGWTALHFACGRRAASCLGVLETLLSADANIKAADNEGITPVMRAILNNNGQVAYWLFKNHPDSITENLLEPDKKGRTLLHHCTKRDNHQVLPLLLRYELDWNAKCYKGKSSVDYAFENGNTGLLVSLMGRYLQNYAYENLMTTHYADKCLEFINTILKSCCPIPIPPITNHKHSTKKYKCTKLALSEAIADMNASRLRTILGAANNDGTLHILKDVFQSSATEREWILTKAFVADDSELLYYIAKALQIKSPQELFTNHSAELIFNLYKDVEDNGNGVWTWVKPHLNLKSNAHLSRSIKKFINKFVGESGGCLEQCRERNEDKKRCKRLNVLFPDQKTSFLLWAVLTGRCSRIGVIIRICTTHDIVPGALFVTILLRKMACTAHFGADTAEQLTTAALYCERLAKNIVFAVYQKETHCTKQVAIQFLKTPLRRYNSLSCIAMAALGNCGEFLSLHCCQEAMSQMWYSPFFMLTQGAEWQKFLMRELLILQGLVIPWAMVAVPYAGCYIEKAIVEFIKEKEGKQIEEDKTCCPVKEKVDVKKCIYYPAEKQSGCIGRIYDFYTTPCVKFHYHNLSHFTYLGLYTYFLLYEFHYTFSGPEIWLTLFAIGLLLEEIIEATNKPIRTYVKDFWNWCDLFHILCFSLGMGLRLYASWITDNPGACAPDFHDPLFYAARVAHCCALLLSYSRLLHIASIFATFGPKLQMIGRMLLHDMLPFLSILAIFMVAFGVVIQALQFPNGFPAPPHSEEATLLHASPYNATACAGAALDTTNGRWTGMRVWRNMFEKAFYTMVGEFFLEEHKGEDWPDCARDGQNCPHAAGRILVPYIFVLFYILCTNVLLLNLLIALFSKTVDNIHNEATNIWFYSCYRTIEEFAIGRYAVPPPLNLIHIPLTIIASLTKLFRTTGYAIKSSKSRSWTSKSSGSASTRSTSSSNYGNNVDHGNLAETGVILDEKETLSKTILEKPKALTKCQRKSKLMKKREYITGLHYVGIQSIVLREIRENWTNGVDFDFKDKEPCNPQRYFQLDRTKSTADILTFSTLYN